MDETSVPVMSPSHPINACMDRDLGGYVKGTLPDFCLWSCIVAPNILHVDGNLIAIYIFCIFSESEK